MNRFKAAIAAQQRGESLELDSLELRTDELGEVMKAHAQLMKAFAHRDRRKDALAECARILDTPAQDPRSGRRIVMAHPAYDQCIKASHLFNLLDARGVISVTERQAYIARVRALAKMCADAFLTTEAAGAEGHCRPIGRVKEGIPLTEYDPDDPYIISEYDLPQRG